MKVIIRNCAIVNDEPIHAKSDCEIKDIQMITITKNNKYIAIETKDHSLFNSYLIDMTRFTIDILKE